MSTVSSATATDSNTKTLDLLKYLSKSSSTSSSTSLISVLTGSSDDSDSSSITDGLSSMASLVSATDNLSSDQKAELKALLKKAQSELGNDDFDAEKLAASAPNDLKSALKSAGVDLESALSSYQTLYDASTGSTVNSSTDYSSLLTSSGDSKLYSIVNTLLNRALED